MIDGELWTREVLTELRTGRFAPAAWTRFLARSLARSRAQRAQRRREHRTVLALGAAGLALWTLAAAADRPWLALFGASWWLLLALMLDWHLGMLERPDGTRLDGLGAANLITILRGGLPPALFALAGTTSGLVLLAAAGAADVVDGRIARRRNEASNLGVWLDGGVDTTIVGSAALGAAHHGLLPVWAATLVLIRLAVPWTAAAAAYFVRAERPPRDGFAAGRLARLVTGAILFTGLALAYLPAPGAGAIVGVGAAGGLGAFGLAIHRTLSGRREQVA